MIEILGIQPNSQYPNGLMAFVHLHIKKDDIGDSRIRITATVIKVEGEYTDPSWVGHVIEFEALRYPSSDIYSGEQPWIWTLADRVAMELSPQYKMSMKFIRQGATA